MITYQDLLAAGKRESDRMDIAYAAAMQHENTDLCKTAKIAEEYYARRNPTMRAYVKTLRDTCGRAVPDYFSPNYKLTHGFFRRFVIQQVQYVLSNGVTFKNKATAAKLGKDFDYKLQMLAKKAMIDGVSFGFWNYDHLEVFSFAPTPNDPAFVLLWDEETGLLMAGVRYWKGTDSAFKMTLYEMDGYTEYIKREGETLRVLQKKQNYVTRIKSTPATGVEEISGVNYPGFPIIPMYANDVRDSEIVGIRPALDCYDFIKSGMANNVDDASAFYWTLHNTGGMDDVDLMRFVERMRTVKAVVLNAETGAEAHTVDVPVEANEKLLDRLRADLYEDFMLLDTDKALSGNLTATAIRLAYQHQDDKCGDFEYCIREFIARLLDLIGIDDEPSFKWNRIANQNEETQMVISAASHLDEKAVLDHLPWLTPEEVTEIMQRREAENAARMVEDEEEEANT